MAESLGRWMIMSRDGAAALLDATAGQENRLDPVLVRGGLHKGKYGLPERLKFADEFAANRDAFSQLQVVTLDREEAFPPVPEEEQGVTATRLSEEAR